MSKNKKYPSNKKLIVGIGSALVDILANEGDDFLERTGAVKGGMTLVDKDFIEQTLSKTKSNTSILPGGSACNTAVGIGKLGGQARFVGKCGCGSMGNLLKSSLIKNNVEPLLFTSSLHTGRVLSIITPDAQRSMFTYLGASSEIKPNEISTGCFDNAAIVHIEGYLVFNSDLILAALDSAKKAGALISLDLASFTVVEESKDILMKIVKEYVDILIANEDEARVYTGFSDEIKAVGALSEGVEIAVLKVGESGSYISNKGKIIKIAPKVAGPAVDTTGAGDLWASGFLFGFANGYSLEKCGELGSACGSEVCRVIGAQIPEEGWDRIKKLVTF
ncbi:MAG: adenosine kinase [Desulfobacterales bacterium]|nr:adenosine kinase [Desulfobacterales bacterium]MDX2508468.1 adenosine kinase [Desulfobacterales bacterium]